MSTNYSSLLNILKFDLRAEPLVIEWLDIKIIKSLVSKRQNQYSSYERQDCEYSLTVEVNDLNKVSKNWSCDVDYVQIHNSSTSCQRNQYMECSKTRLSGSQKSVKLYACCTDRIAIVGAFKLNDGHLVDHNRSNEDTQFLDAHVATTDFRANCEIFLDDSSRPIYVNRELLSIYSPVFLAMFDGEFAESNSNRIAIPNVSTEEFIAFLRCLYLPVDPITEKNIVAVFKVADQFNCTAILKECEQFLKYNLPSNVDGFKKQIELADRLNLTDLLKRLLDRAPREFFPEFLNPEWTSDFKQSTMQAIQQKAAWAFKELLKDAQNKK